MTAGWLPPIESIASAYAGLGAPAVPAFLVDAARGKNRALPTLLSWWELQGRTLPGPLAAELACHRRRLAAYSQVLAGVQRREPAVVPAKGPTMWSLYPEGLVRQTADLDLVAPSAPALWSVARHLVDQGWEANRMWVWRIAATTHFHVVLNRSSPEPMLLPEARIEVTTVAYPGDHVWREPRPRSWPVGSPPSLADCLAWFLDELGERRLHMRDLFDLAVLTHAAEEQRRDDVATEAAELVRAYRLGPQLRRLERDARRCHPPAVPTLALIGRKAAAKRWAAPWPLRRRPLTAGLSLAVAVARRGGPDFVRDRADDVVAGVHRRVSALRLFQQGAPVYGMAVPGCAPAAEVTVSCDGHVLWFDTPVGRFVGALGPAVLQEWIDRASSAVPAPRRLALA